METTAFNGSIGCPFNQKGVVVKWSCYFVEKAWTECAFEGWITGMHEMRWSCRPLEDAVEELASFIRKSDAWCIPSKLCRLYWLLFLNAFLHRIAAVALELSFPFQFWWLTILASLLFVFSKYLNLRLFFIPPSGSKMNMSGTATKSTKAHTKLRFWDRCWWPNSTCFECICQKRIVAERIGLSDFP